MSAGAGRVIAGTGAALADPGDRAVAALLRAAFSPAAAPDGSGATAWDALRAFLRGGPPPPRAAGGRGGGAPVPAWPRSAEPGPLMVPGWGAWAGPLPARLDRRPGGTVVVAVVDDVPVAAAWPEYAPLALVARLSSAVAAMARHATVVAVPEPGAAARLRALLAGAGRLPPIAVVPRPSVLAAEGGAAEPPGRAARPYLVACGPLEARANTLLLLQLWRGLLREGVTPPLLVLAGPRGADAEDIRPLLDWNEGLRAVVAEAPALAPGELRSLLGNARALLAPDFAGADAALLRDAVEGGVPVVAADTPPVRTLAGAALLHPLDGPGWRAAALAAVRRMPNPGPSFAPTGLAAYAADLRRLVAAGSPGAAPPAP